MTVQTDPSPDRLRRSDSPPSGEGKKSLVVLAAGGTGGHLFPAEALADILIRRGLTVDLATDHRAERYGARFPARQTHIIPSDTVRARHPVALARTAFTLGRGLWRAYFLLRRLKPVAVVGFGGYPTLPPVAAATVLKIPTVIHDSNAVIGRANHQLAPRVTAIATTFEGVLASDPALAAKTTRTGNPLRPAVIAAAAMPYAAPEPGGLLRLLVFGGSQGGAHHVRDRASGDRNA
jgi:UDP-N-acetylglucosamine--N-acetylmuramyl-(pentapeptide) pyrophosphoryl-undecaprenol N-acetylglucosamine transferase